MDYRIEKDSMGEVKVPANALYAAQTQRAVENFPISGYTFPRSFICAIGLVKAAAAKANGELGVLEEEKAKAIVAAATEIAGGNYDEHFPIDIFQTGSGTSTNMNANEVIANLASQNSGIKIHPNDDVNCSQSSNDVIPTTIHVAAALEIHDNLLPSLRHLHSVIIKRAKETEDIVKTGRTHLMDAMPITLGQELSGYAGQIMASIEALLTSQPRLLELAAGGTAVGTGINAHPEFGSKLAEKLNEITDISFIETRNHFGAQSSMNSATEISGQLKTIASFLFKIANDLRFMNSGPQAGFAEISLPSLQPGSSIMPGKINPVIAEAAMMACAQVMGNDVTINFSNASGNFQLNVMLPVIAYNLLESITLVGNTARVMADKAIAGFTVNEEHIRDLVDRNPILVTVLNPIIGYEKGSIIAKKAFKERRRLKDVALEETDISEEHLDELLDAKAMTQGGIKK